MYIYTCTHVLTFNSPTMNPCSIVAVNIAKYEKPPIAIAMHACSLHPLNRKKCS